MSSGEYIPKATADKIAEPIPVGSRNNTGLQIAMSLIGNGTDPSTVFSILRAKFDSDFTDREINNIIAWAVSKRPEPSKVSTPHPQYKNASYAQKPAIAAPSRTPLEHALWWVSDSRTSPDQLCDSSPTSIPSDLNECCKFALGALYSDKDHLNIVCDFIINGEKANPKGAGRTLLRDEWIKWVESRNVPHSKAGAWFRINPCASVGSGDNGAITDADVTQFKYLLLESDCLPVNVQLALFQRLSLPIAAIVLSGGGSAHAWVKLESPSGEAYRDFSKRILEALKPFGIDQANKNPSRLSRLPGAIRQIGASDGGIQRLIWLNPNASALTDDGLKSFIDSLQFPAIEDQPLRSFVSNAISRYEDMYNNRGRLGVTYGVPQLDAISGGMKPGQTIIVAGTTGGGKSTYALHLINSALEKGTGVSLFSLEMDKDEVLDLIVANRCSINRNKFNTGEFVDYDFEAMKQNLPKIQKLPLYIDDSALTGVDQIRTRVLQLKSANKIGLVVVDYIQFINPGLTKDNREQQVSAISHALRAMARETKLPFVILSQLNDEGKLRESRVIAHNANVVITVEVENDTFNVNVVKGRGIPTGQYSLEFNRMFARLEPKEINEQND